MGWRTVTLLRQWMLGRSPRITVILCRYPSCCCVAAEFQMPHHSCLSRQRGVAHKQHRLHFFMDGEGGDVALWSSISGLPKAESRAKTWYWDNLTQLSAPTYFDLGTCFWPIWTVIPLISEPDSQKPHCAAALEPSEQFSKTHTYRSHEWSKVRQLLYGTPTAVNHPHLVNALHRCTFTTIMLAMLGAKPPRSDPILEIWSQLQIYLRLLYLFFFFTLDLQMTCDSCAFISC